MQEQGNLQGTQCEWKRVEVHLGVVGVCCTFVLSAPSSTANVLPYRPQCNAHPAGTTRCLRKREASWPGVSVCDLQIMLAIQ